MSGAGDDAADRRAGRGPRANGARPDRAQSRFLCNGARKVSLVFLVVAVAALVIGAGFAGISKNGSPTSMETDVVRWVILGSVVVFVVSYVAGGRLQRRRSFPRSQSGLGRTGPGDAHRDP